MQIWHIWKSKLKHTTQSRALKGSQFIQPTVDVIKNMDGFTFQAGEGRKDHWIIAWLICTGTRFITMWRRRSSLERRNTDEGKDFWTWHLSDHLHAGEEGAELLISVQIQTGAASSWPPLLSPSWMFFLDWELDWDLECWLHCLDIPCFQIWCSQLERWWLPPRSTDESRSNFWPSTHPSKVNYCSWFWFITVTRRIFRVDPIKPRRREKNIYNPINNQDW